MSLIFSSDNSSVYRNEDGTVTKVMKYMASTLRELSFNELCQGADRILHPISTTHKGDTVEIIYPYAQDLLEAKLPYEEIFIQGIRILSILEKLKIVHLDFRPENIGVINGKLYLRDFGNAYLLRGDTGYVSYFRYPVEAIRPAEFMSLADDRSRGLRAYISLKRTFEPASVVEQDDNSFIPNLYGSQFDTRADLWSFGSWLHHYIFGVRPFGSFFQKDLLIKKYGMIGRFLVQMLDPDYTVRAKATTIAYAFDISVPYVDLFFHDPVFKHKILTHFSFESIIKQQEDVGELISQYSDLLIFTQNSTSKNVLDHAKLFASRDVLAPEDVKKFLDVGTLFFSSFYERDNFMSFVDMVVKPPRAGTWTWKDQYDYVLGLEEEDPEDRPPVIIDPKTSEQITKDFIAYVESLPDDADEAEAAEILGVYSGSESDEE